MRGPLLVFGKRQGRSSIEALLLGHTNNLLYLYESIQKVSILIDSGADCSIFPANSIQRKFRPKQNNLFAANGTPITSYGMEDFNLQFAEHNFHWKFHLTASNKVILGSDFLKHHNAILDYNNKTLSLRDGTVLKLFSSPMSNPAYPINNLGHSEFYTALLNKSIISKPISKDFTTIKTNVKFHISTAGAPIVSKPRRLNPEKLKAAKSEFTKMEQLGIVRRSSSQWASPLHMVKKPNGEWRPCGDYRRVNTITTPDRYPIPNIQDFAQNLNDCKIFSKVDLIRGYLQVPVIEDDIAKTAVTTPFGLFEFTRMPFGLRNAAQTFQRLMDEIFNNLDFVFVYIDDILIASPNHETHREHVTTVFNLLNQAGLQVNQPKCEFGKHEIEFLGHFVTAEGLRPSAQKVKAIQEYRQPNSSKELSRFVGMVNFYHRFLPKIANLLKPLYEAISLDSKNLIWNKEMVESFQIVKDKVAEDTLLKFPIPNAPLTLTTDASNIAIGAVISQHNQNVGEPLAYFSQTLTPTQQRYSTFDRELQAIFSAIRHFRHILEGRPFRVLTDHKPLTFILNKKSDLWSARQQRQVSFISEFTSEIEHIPGNQNIAADALSRTTIQAVTGTVYDFHQFAISQKRDHTIQGYKVDPKSLKIKSLPFGNQPINILCDISTGKPRPLVPEEWTQKIFDQCHSISHPSIRSTLMMIKERFVWERMNRDITEWVKACPDCQRSKIQKHIKAPIEQIPHPTGRFQHIHVDIVGPLPQSNSKKYLFTIIDRYSRWPDAIPIAEATSDKCIKALMFNWISRHGIPKTITCDNGRQFTSEKWRHMCRQLQIESIYSSTYHPQSNGLVERFHRTLKQALKAKSDGIPHNWSKTLPLVLLGLRVTPKEDFEHSASEMIYGENIRTPMDIQPNVPTNHHMEDKTLVEAIKKTCQNTQNTQPVYHGTCKSHIPKNLENATHIMVRKPNPTSLVQPYEGPYKIMSRTPKVITIKKGALETNVSIDRVKVAHTKNLEEDN